MTHAEAMDKAFERLARALLFPEGSSSRMNEAQLAAAYVAYARELREELREESA